MTNSVGVSTAPQRSSGLIGHQTLGRFVLFISAGLVLLGFLWVLAGTLLASNRGLDVTDEGLYLLAADPPSRTAAWFWPFGWSTAPLFASVGYDIAAFRTAGAVLLMLAGGWLGWSSVSLVSLRRHAARPRHRMDVLLGALAATTGMFGTLLFYGSFLRTPSYNWANFLGILVSAGGAVALISVRINSSPTPVRFSSWLPGAVTALGLFITIPAKPSTAPFVLLLLTFLLVTWLGLRGGLAAVVMIVTLLLSWLALALLTTWWPMEFVSVLTQGYGSPAPTESHTVVGALRDTLNLPRSMVASLRNAPREQLGVLLLGFAVQIIPVFIGKRLLLVRMVGFAISAMAAWLLPEVVGFLSLIVAAVVLLVRLNDQQWFRDQAVDVSLGRLGSLLLFQIALAFVYGFGSTAGVYGKAADVSVLFAIAALTAATGISRSRLRIVAVGTIALFTSLSVLTSLTNARQMPYRQPPIDTQTEVIQVGSRGGDIMVDPDLHGLLQSLRSQADEAGWVEGTPLVGVAWRWSSTVPYALGAVVPESLMLTLFGYESAQSVAEYNLEARFQEFPWEEAWLFTTDNTEVDVSVRADVRGVLEALEEGTGRPFPSGYTCVARAGKALIWKPVLASTDLGKMATNEGFCPPAEPETSPYDFSGGWSP